jgi:GDP-4-dehydro-6-deoxy-D-mannose reductase
VKALVTGITGFVGTHLAEHLLAMGDRVLGTCRSGGWPADTSPELARRVPLTAWDLAGSLDAEARQAIESFAPDCLYHLAAVSSPGNCGESCPTPHAVRVNVGGLEQALELALALPARPRVLFVSSSHVYAPVSPACPAVAEDAPLGPWRGYGMTKLAAEEALRRAVAERGTDALIARAFQHLGPRQPAWSMLSEWARQLAQGGSAPIRVYNCTTWVDATDVRDMVRAYRLLVLSGTPGQAYNVGSGRARLSGEILEALRADAGSDRPVAEQAPGPRTDPIAEIGRLLRCTGWRPEISLQQSVADTLAWWRGRLSKTPA